MRKLVFLTLILLFAAMLSACAKAMPQVAERMINPGDKVGEMTIEKAEDKHYWLYNSCNSYQELLEPGSQTLQCTVSELAGVSIGPIWGAETSKFEASWKPMTWELYVDDYQIVLDEFGYSDISYYEPSAGFDVTFRSWNILLRNLTAGKHTFRFSFTLVSAVNDGWNTYSPGKYEYVYDLTVTAKPVYPILPQVAKPGQHVYASKNGDLDFLLYVPDSYGVDPAKKWPLIVYLHDAEWRGSPDFMLNESLPKRLQTLKDFEFLVFSPSGDGDWDFWSKDEMITPVVHALDEIKAIYLVDPARIYLTGAGMGGNGVWVMGMRNPDYFASLAPLGGYVYPFGVPENICSLKNVPVWAFHGEEDFMVPTKVEQDLVNAVNACGGAAQFTVKSGAVIPLDVYNNSELFDWFLAYSNE